MTFPFNPTGPVSPGILMDRAMFAKDAAEGIAGVVGLTVEHLEREHVAASAAIAALGLVLTQARELADQLSDLESYFRQRDEAEASDGPR